MSALTAKRLRKELAGVPDETPITIAYRRSANDAEPIMLVAYDVEDLSKTTGFGIQVLLQATRDHGIGELAAWVAVETWESAPQEIDNEDGTTTKP